MQSNYKVFRFLCNPLPFYTASDLVVEKVSSLEIDCLTCLKP